jgi:hypothetical protein
LGATRQETYPPKLIFDEIDMPPKELELPYKKWLFYNVCGLKRLEYLESMLASVRPQIMDPDQCWLHVGRTKAEEDRGTLGRSIRFKYGGERYMYFVNLGFIALFVKGLLDKVAKDGIVHHAWHASHLCGNWYCTNPQHLVAEPGPVNQRRNACLWHAELPCSHTPRCLKHLRIPGPPARVEL